MTFTELVKEEILNEKVWDLKSTLKQEEQLKRVYVREAFLKSGSISDPSGKYHLEIVFKQKEKAGEILDILKQNDLNFKIIERRKSYVLYLKSGEEISNFLAFIGASNAVLRFEEARVVRQTRENVNRKVNCETANLEKTVNASIKQVEAIEYLKKIGKFDELEDGLKEIAMLRYENPEASLDTISKLLSTPISKSGANHRLSKIIKIAEEYKKSRNKNE